MTRRTVFGTLAVAGLALLLVGGVPAQQKEEKKAPPKEEKKAPTNLLAKLAEPFSLPNGIDGNTPFKDAVDSFSDKHGVLILIDYEGFKEAGVTGIEDQPVRMPKFVNFRFGTALRLLAAQMNGTFLIRPDHIEITSRTHARARWSFAEVWPRGEIGAAESDQPELERALAPLVYAQFDRRPLEDALNELADQAGVSVLIDARRAGEKAQMPVSAKVVNMPLDTAVRLLADMAELKAVVVDNGMYVTTTQHAATLQGEIDKRRQKQAALNAAAAGVGLSGLGSGGGAGLGGGLLR